MRFARGLVLAALAAVAAMAFVAPSASALEVVNEATNAHCVATPTKNCLLHGINTSGSVELGGPFFMTNCQNEFEGYALENGEGQITRVEITACSPTNVIECRDAAGDIPWPSELATGEEDGPYTANETKMEVQFCLQSPFSLTCHLEIDLVEASPHNYVLRTGSPHVHRACENNGLNSVQGEWALETTNHAKIEIKH